MGRPGRRLPAVAAVLYGALAALVPLGIRDVLFVYEENRCGMTYMYEYPEYLKIKLPKKTARRYPAYELYLYGEGNYAEENKNLMLSGIPVLFLPGNAGSYKQARSLGSIALRKAEDLDFKYHFNFFSVNFNEELVALYGGTLQRQTKFVHECLKVILKLYKGQEFAPTSVAIVGHSMGGLVARALLTLKNFKPELINLIITQATPHVAPVMPLDRYLTDFYAAVNNHWILKAQDLRNLTTLSVAGGFRDYQVRSGLAFLPRLSQHDSALSVVSSAVPRTWASTDHLSIVWCKELILATIRAFFDLIDENTRQKRMSVLNHHFVRHPGKIFEENPEAFTELTGTFAWIKVKTSKWTYSVYNDTSSWIYGCMNSDSSGCLEATDLSWKAELLPTVKVVILKLQDYPSLSHIVILVPPSAGNKVYQAFKIHVESHCQSLIGKYTCSEVILKTSFLQILGQVIKLSVNVRAEQNMLNRDSDGSEERSQNSVRCTVKNQNVIDSTSEATQSLSNSATAEAANSLKIHVTMLNLFTWIVLLNLPSLVYWLKNLRYSVQLDPDPCRATAIILVCILEILMNSSASEVKSRLILEIFLKKMKYVIWIPSARMTTKMALFSLYSYSKLLKIAAKVPLPLSVAMLAFGRMHLYKVPHFVTFSFLLHALCCIV
ncbi:hypothetical protein ASZ78_002372 [Callipepla squamata]|uniref:GPI inositol-deacylase n=1 Tax=Callipepla squamata TaxID=9009 RepID=A0A226MP59_CALSU|nr:hypothetical protein ASZ78_002372 [Callipepla squamata]